jgi:FMN reductase
VIEVATDAPRQARCRLLVISSSASGTSRSEKLGDHLAAFLSGPTVHVDHLKLRVLPAGPLLAADVSDTAIAAAVNKLDEADGLIVVTPTYKATYTGLLKVFIDLLPQYALRGKTVLPLATGGTVAHVLMLDYGLRPVLQTMWPRHIAQGCFVLDKHLIVESGQLRIDDASMTLLSEVLGAFRQSLSLAEIEPSRKHLAEVILDDDVRVA